MSDILERARALQDQMVVWRRDIHMHPELGFQEIRTAGIVAGELRRLGMEVQTGIAKTGVVARLGEGKPVVAIRADMDALPIQEVNQVEYASQTPDKMHACGHDAHTAMLLGAANILNAMPNRPPGEIRFLFQPSEEGQDTEDKSGGMRMVEENAMEGVDAVIALHVDSKTRPGVIEITDGFVSAAVDSFYATIIGKGGHGAYPHETVDPFFILAQVMNALQGICARRISPVKPAVVSIGYVHGGIATNVIPDSVELGGTLRSYHDDVREQILREVENAFGVAKALGGDFKLRIQRGYPSMYNDPGVSEMIHQVGTDLFGADDVTTFEPMMGAEDFSYMQQKAPGAMFRLGAKYDTEDRPHHNPNFNIDESVLQRGAAMLAETACRLLREKG